MGFEDRKFSRESGILCASLSQWQCTVSFLYEHGHSCWVRSCRGQTRWLGEEPAIKKEKQFCHSSMAPPCRAIRNVNAKAKYICALTTVSIQNRKGLDDTFNPCVIFQFTSVGVTHGKNMILMFSKHCISVPFNSF